MKSYTLHFKTESGRTVVYPLGSAATSYEAFEKGLDSMKLVYPSKYTDFKNAVSFQVKERPLSMVTKKIGNAG